MESNGIESIELNSISNISEKTKDFDRYNGEVMFRKKIKMKTEFKNKIDRILFGPSSNDRGGPLLPSAMTIIAILLNRLRGGRGQREIEIQQNRIESNRILYVSRNNRHCDIRYQTTHDVCRDLPRGQIQRCSLLLSVLRQQEQEQEQGPRLRQV